MRGHISMSRFGPVFGLAVVLALLAAPHSPAAEVVFSPQHNPPNSEDGWQAGTCKVPTCAPDDKPPSAVYFEQAAGHPPFGITQFIVRHKTEGLHKEPEVDMRT